MSELNHKDGGRRSSPKDISSQDTYYDAARKQLHSADAQSSLDPQSIHKPWRPGPSQDHNDSSYYPSMLDPPQRDRRRLPNPRSARGNSSTMPRPDQDVMREHRTSRAELGTGSFADHTPWDFYTATLFDANGSQEASAHGEQSSQRTFTPVNPSTPLFSSANTTSTREQLPTRKPQICYRCSLKHETCNGRKPSCDICIKDAKECKYRPRKFYSCDQCLKDGNPRYRCNKEKPKCSR
jgi:hypothetical protein